MWEDQEWYDYMKKHNMKDPYVDENQSSLAGFFD
jgi:hypothetical protein